jgi:hypothetical protein
MSSDETYTSMACSGLMFRADGDGDGLSFRVSDDGNANSGDGAGRGAVDRGKYDEPPRR